MSDNRRCESCGAQDVPLVIVGTIPYCYECRIKQWESTLTPGPDRAAGSGEGGTK